MTLLVAEQASWALVQCSSPLSTRGSNLYITDLQKGSWPWRQRLITTVMSYYSHSYTSPDMRGMISIGLELLEKSAL